MDAITQHVTYARQATQIYRTTQTLVKVYRDWTKQSVSCYRSGYDNHYIRTPAPLIKIEEIQRQKAISPSNTWNRTQVGFEI